MLKFLKFIFITVIILSNSAFVIYNTSRIPQIYKERKFIKQRIALLKKQKLSSGNLKSDLSVQKSAVPVRLEDKRVEVLSNKKSINKSDLRLLGIIQGKTALAFIELRDRKASSIYAEGDTISGMKIVRILKNSVLVKADGRKQVLRLENLGPKDEKPAIEKISEEERLIVKEAFITNVLQVAQETNKIKITPAINQQNKKIAGLQVSNIPQEGVIKEMGLLDNDIVCKVNGMQVESIPQAIELVRELRGSKVVEIEIIRNNLPMNLKYQIKENLAYR